MVRPDSVLKIVMVYSRLHLLLGAFLMSFSWIGREQYLPMVKFVPAGSMGAAARIPVIEAGAMPDAITQLRAKGITCLAAALYKSQPLSAAQASYPGGVCVVIGSEGQGLTDETIAACSSTVRIPMTDRVESLNAGIAGSILLWHFREESL